MINLVHTGIPIVDVILTIGFLVLITYPIIGGFAWFIGVLCLHIFIQLSAKRLG